MAPTSNRFLDDIARLMTDAAGAAQGVRREVETVFKGQIERLLQEMEIAKQEELDVLRDMVVAAREENEQLAIRMKALEERLAALEGLPRGGEPSRALDLGRHLTTGTLPPVDGVPRPIAARARIFEPRQGFETRESVGL